MSDGIRFVGVAREFAELLAAAKQGDEAAFLELFGSVQPRLLRFLSTLGGASAEDLAAETWLQVVRGLPGFDGDRESFRAWVFAIARARRIDHLRARDRQPRSLDIATVAEADLPRREDVSDLVEARISTQEALRLIATLPPAQAEVIMLRVVAGLEVADTAQIVGRPPGTVRVLAHRGLRRLAQMLTTGADGTVMGRRVTREQR